MAVQVRQRGLSLISFIFTAAVITIFAAVGFRVAPAYFEYFAVQKALESTLEDDTATNATRVRTVLDNRLSAQYVDAIRAADVQVTRDGNAIVATIEWQRVLHMVGNASILLEFTAQAQR